MLTSLTEADLDRPASQPTLMLDTAEARGRRLDLIYAPFDYVNPAARIVIVGLTPGARQATDALRACRSALLAGIPADVALADAKRLASFAGPMRRNLVAMLDIMGVPALLGIQTCATLWTTNEHVAHFTSAVRYPMFVNGTNWSGTPDVLTTPPIRNWLEAYAPAEFRQLSKALFVPLGGAVARALHHLADLGYVQRDRILAGLPHPSGANAERIACFIGTKAAELASSRTDGRSLVEARLRLSYQVSEHVRRRDIESAGNGS